WPWTGFSARRGATAPAGCSNHRGTETRRRNENLLFSLCLGVSVVQSSRASIMTITIEAVYEYGVLKPAQPLPLEERAKVRVTISAPSSWVQRTAGMLGWKGSHEELEPFALGKELEYLADPEEP